MGFFDNLGENFAGVAKEVGQKAKELGGTAKTHANIKAEEVKIQEQYYKLGKEYYSLYKDAPDSALTTFVETINQCNEKIANYREELANGGSEEENKEAVNFPDDTKVEDSEIQDAEFVEVPKTECAAQEEASVSEDMPTEN